MVSKLLCKLIKLLQIQVTCTQNPVLRGIKEHKTQNNNNRKRKLILYYMTVFFLFSNAIPTFSSLVLCFSQ